MADTHPRHPVREQKQFECLQQIAKCPKPTVWGVKLKLGKRAGGTWWQANNVKWVYGRTPLEALDGALAFLVAEALSE